MTQLKKQKVFTVVKVGDGEFPTEKGIYHFNRLENIDNDTPFTQYVNPVSIDKDYWKDEKWEWLKEGEKYVFDDEGLIELLKEAFEKSREYPVGNPFAFKIRSFEEYLLSKGISVKEKVSHHDTIR